MYRNWYIAAFGASAPLRAFLLERVLIVKLVTALYLFDIVVSLERPYRYVPMLVRCRWHIFVYLKVASLVDSIVVCLEVTILVATTCSFS